MSSLATLIVRKSLSLAQSMVEPYAEGSMNYLVRITRNGNYDTDTGEYDPDGERVIYADDEDTSLGARAGVLGSSGPSSMNYGDEPEFYDSVTVLIPRSSPAEPIIDDIVRIMAGPDSDLMGRYFKVTSSQVGGRLVPSTTLQCVGVAKSRQWGNE